MSDLVLWDDDDLEDTFEEDFDPDVDDSDLTGPDAYWDGLHLCSVCGDQDTTNEDAICSDCHKQAWIDKHG